MRNTERKAGAGYSTGGRLCEGQGRVKMLAFRHSQHVCVPDIVPMQTVQLKEAKAKVCNMGQVPLAQDCLLPRERSKVTPGFCTTV